METPYPASRTIAQRSSWPGGLGFRFEALGFRVCGLEFRGSLNKSGAQGLSPNPIRFHIRSHIKTFLRASGLIFSSSISESARPPSIPSFPGCLYGSRNVVDSEKRLVSMLVRRGEGEGDSRTIIFPSLCLCLSLSSFHSLSGFSQPLRRKQKFHHHASTVRWYPLFSLYNVD